MAGTEGGRNDLMSLRCLGLVGQAVEVCEHHSREWVLGSRRQEGPHRLCKGRDWKKGRETGRRHTFSYLQLFPKLVCLALGGHLCNIKGSLRQLLISCWKELGINMDSGLLLNFWLRLLKVAYP